MQELSKFILKINFIPNRLEKYVGFSINTKLNFINSFQLLSSSLVSLKTINKDDFNYFSQEFDNNKLNLVKKGFYSYQYMSDFEKFKEELPSKEKFYSSLTGNRK